MLNAAISNISRNIWGAIAPPAPSLPMALSAVEVSQNIVYLKVWKLRAEAIRDAPSNTL